MRMCTLRTFQLTHHTVSGQRARKLRLVRRLLFSFAAVVTTPISLPAQTTAFNYQGQLNLNGSPASGSHDMLFYLRDAASGGNTISTTNTFDGNFPNQPPVSVDNNGLFTVTLDFGSTP